ncbi:MAG: phospho-N-acetylmuramoyl-pentapeptide-transferase [Candidatus Moraniibacteriota bacterium]
MSFAEIYTVPLYLNVIKVFLLTLIAFVVAMAWTPLLTNFLYKYGVRAKIKEKSVDGKAAPIYYNLHKEKAGTPLMGGLLVWVTVLVLALVFNLLGNLVDGFFKILDFLRRSQTWLPMFALASTGFLGVIDDIKTTRGTGTNKGGGMRFLYRFWWLLVIAILGGIWFYYKLDFTLVHIPGFGDIDIGWWYIPFFVFVILATAISSNETDGLDGLNGGVLLTAFSVYGVIAFVQHRIDLAAFCGVIVGGLLAFLWFNVHPARFFMGDTGAISLGTALGVVAMLTNSVIILPIVCFVYVIESLSAAIQLTSKKFFGKKVFLSAPIHHHLQAIGWPESKVVMRLWILSGVMGVVGLVIGIFGMGK